MEKWNREIPVLSLQEVCALQLAKKRHSDHIAILRSEADSVCNGAVWVPPAEKKEEYTGFMGAASISARSPYTPIFPVT